MEKEACSVLRDLCSEATFAPLKKSAKYWISRARLEEKAGNTSTAIHILKEGLENVLDSSLTKEINQEIIRCIRSTIDAIEVEEMLNRYPFSISLDKVVHKTTIL